MITATALKKSFNEEHVIEHQRTKFLAMYNINIEMNHEHEHEKNDDRAKHNK